MHSKLSSILLYSLLQPVWPQKAPVFTLPLQFLPSLEAVFSLFFLSTKTLGKHAEVDTSDATGTLQAVATS